MTDQLTSWTTIAGRRLVAAMVLALITGLAACRPAQPVAPAGASHIEEHRQVIHLTDVAATSGLAAVFSSGRSAGHHSILEWVGGGVAILDYDNNEQLDLFIAGGGDLQGKVVSGVAPHLYRNLGQLELEDVSKVAGVTDVQQYNHGCHAADYNNDGFADVLITGYGGLQLYENLGDGTFRDVTAACSLTDRLWSTSAAWADFDTDGNLDLYICHYVNWSFENHPTCRASKDGPIDACAPKRFDPLPDVIYYSNGDGSFRDATSAAGLEPGGKGLGVVVADLDSDHDMDIYVANDTTANFLYLNDGGVFQETAVLNGVSGDEFGQFTGSMGVDVGDYNADGLIDLWAANYVDEPFALYRNLGQGYFQHVSNSAGLNALGAIYVGFGTGFVDLDGDDDDDLIVANGHVLQYPPSSTVAQLPLILSNNGTGHFAPEKFTADDGYLGTPHLGRSVAWGDLDRDGDLDFAITHLDEPTALLRNDTESHPQSISVRLVGVISNRDGVGCVAEIETANKRLLRLKRGGGSYLSQSSTPLCWSFGSRSQLEGERTLHVTWPSGRITTLDDPQPGYEYVLVEPIQEGARGQAFRSAKREGR